MRLLFTHMRAFLIYTKINDLYLALESCVQHVV